MRICREQEGNTGEEMTEASEPPSKIKRMNAAGLRRLAHRTSLAARVGQFVRPHTRDANRLSNHHAPSH
jgi:hypothetical protein